MSPTLEQRISEMRKRRYAALKLHDPQRYQQAIQAAEAVTLNHRLPQKAAVDVEAAVVLAVYDALGLRELGEGRAQ